jgi:iron complex outermembrane receptor protein
MLMLSGIVHAQSGPAKRADTTISPKPKVVELKTATVTARRPLIVQKAGMTIVNVDALISNTGSTALDVLSNTPGLLVDEDGSITLKGKEGAAVYIDGKPSHLSGTELAGYLRSLPSGTLDRIEIMSNPPARYDASGTGGIINIVTKKTTTGGFSGSVTGNIGLGIYGSSNNNLNWSYRRDKLSLSGNAGLNIGNGYFNSDRVRRYSNPDGSPRSSILEHYYEHSNRVSPGGRLGIDYDLTKTSRLEIAFSGSAAPYDERGDYQSQYFNAGGMPDSSMIVNSHFRTDWTSAVTNLTFHISFPGRSAAAGGHAITGKELTIGLDNYSYHDLKDQLLSTAVYAPDKTLISMDDVLPHQPLSSNNYEFHGDYTGPLGQTGKFGTGWEITDSRVDNNSEYTTRVNNVAVVDDALSNRFLYRQKVYAGYGTADKEWGKFSFHAGLRLENTVTNSRLIGNSAHADTSFSGNYTDLFPDVQLSYKTDSMMTHQLFFSLGRRIDRPGEEDLNPARFLFDKNTISTGNPLLRPQFATNIELSHVYRQNITTTFQYSDSRDLIMRSFRQEGSLFISFPANIGRVITWGMNIGASATVTRRWTAILYTEFFRKTYRQSQESLTGPLNGGGSTWLMSVNNQLKLGNGWAGEITGFYRTTITQPQYFIRPLWYVNATVRKKIADERITLNLGLRDVFHSRTFRRVLNTLPQQQIVINNSTDTRVLSLSLICQLGKMRNGRTDQRKSDIRSEINRLKSGN